MRKIIFRNRPIFFHYNNSSSSSSPKRTNQRKEKPADSLAQASTFSFLLKRATVPHPPTTKYYSPFELEGFPFLLSLFLFASS